jgi:hypothetical protein
MNLKHLSLALLLLATPILFSANLVNAQALQPTACNSLGVCVNSAISDGSGCTVGNNSKCFNDLISSTTSSATTTQSKIQALLQAIAAIRAAQATMGSGTTNFCYQFNNNIASGDLGSGTTQDPATQTDITNLNKVLAYEGVSDIYAFQKNMLHIF